jgi:Tfp pilus assembly protein PilF
LAVKKCVPKTRSFVWLRVSTMIERSTFQSRFRQLANGGWLSIALVSLAGVAPGWSAPFAPRDDAQVLERLRTLPADAATRSVRQLRAQLAAQPRNLELAARLARRYLEKSRADSDPRFLGYAQSALAPWWHLAQPPVSVLVLRATIRQSNHDFESALSDLTAALERDPQNAQAWLTKAIVLQVRGDYDEARRCCLPLWRLTSELVAVTCASSTASLNGDATKSFNLLRQSFGNAINATPSEKAWAATVLAEIAARLGRTHEAEDYFRRALAVGQRDAYLLGACADFLLDQDRPEAVIPLVAEETLADALLLRLALAEQNLSGKSARQREPLAAHIALLEARFEASRRRGDAVHRREEARFALHLLQQPVAALELARANWNVQREPADSRILLEAALAARNGVAAHPVLEWLAKNKTEDVQLTKLADQLRALE